MKRKILTGIALFAMVLSCFCASKDVIAATSELTLANIKTENKYRSIKRHFSDATILRMARAAENYIDGPYYYCFDMPIRLTVSTEKVGVCFDESVDVRDRTAILHADPDLRYVDVPQFPAAMTIVPLREGLDTDSVMNIVSGMATLAQVKYASPVFTAPKVSGRLEMLLSYEFTAAFRPEVTERQIEALNKANGVEVIKTLRMGSERYTVYDLRVTNPKGMHPIEMLHMVNQYHESGYTRWVSPDFMCMNAATATPDDEHYPDQWHLNNTAQNCGAPGHDINAAEAWDTETGDTDLVIAILDNGVDLDHPDLNIVDGWDFMDDDAVPEPEEGDYKPHHGTQCAGIAAAKTDNDEVGVAGVAWGLKIMPVRIRTALPLHGPVRDGIIYARENGADIISCSLGVAYTPALATAIAQATTDGRNGKGCIIVAASGNDGDPGVTFPATHKDVIAVGRTHCNDEWFWDSNYGPELDVVAPGWNIKTTMLDGSYGTVSGTSAATPVVAGLAALVLSRNPEFTAAQVQAIIQFSAEDESSGDEDDEADEPGRDQCTGYGRVDAAAAIDLADKRRLIINDNDGVHLASFDTDGNFVLEGNLNEGATTALDATPESEFIIRDSSLDEVARIVGSGTSAGDMYIAGILTEEASSLDPGNDRAFLVKDNSGATVAYIDENGNIVLKGRAFIGGDPDRASSRFVPEGPLDLVASAVGKTAVDLSWSDKSEDETGFKIYRYIYFTNITHIGTVGANVKSYEDRTGLVCEVEYKYFVKAYNAAGYSAPSSIEEVETFRCYIPAAPTDLDVTAHGSSNIMYLDWWDRSDNEDGFEVECSPDGSSNWALVAVTGEGIRWYTHPYLDCNTTYYYRVRAYNSAGYSDYTNVDSDTTPSCWP